LRNARYDAVIWLQTAAAIQIYDGSDSNACRFENADTAVRSGEALKQLLHSHACSGRGNVTFCYAVLRFPHFIAVILPLYL